MAYNICIIGCGARGKGHAKAWDNRTDTQVAAVCDIREDRMTELAREYNAAAYEDYRDAICHEGIDIVSVCTPTHLHPEVTCHAAENGKHIFCEKPLALTLEDGGRALEAVRQNNVVFSPCFQHRDFPVYVKQREVFQSGAFDGPVHLRFTDVREVRPKTAMHRTSMNGGVVIDMGCHLFDMIRHITGEEPVSVFAAGEVYGRGKKRLEGIEDLAVDVASIEVRMTGGHLLSMYLNWGMPEGFPYPFNGPVLVGANLSVFQQEGEVIVQYADHREAWKMEGAGNTARIQSVMDAVQGKAEPDATGTDAYIALKMSLAALESIETGKAVEIT